MQKKAAAWIGSSTRPSLAAATVQHGRDDAAAAATSAAASALPQPKAELPRSHHTLPSFHLLCPYPVLAPVCTQCMLCCRPAGGVR